MSQAQEHIRSIFNSVQYAVRASNYPDLFIHICAPEPLISPDITANRGNNAGNRSRQSLETGRGS